MSKLFLIGIIFLGALLFGCTSVQNQVDQARETARDVEQVAQQANLPSSGYGSAGVEEQGEAANGNLGEKVSNNLAEVTVHNLVYHGRIGEGTGSLSSGEAKFLILNLTVKNIGNANLKPLSYMKVFTSLTDSYGSRPFTGAVEVMPSAFLPGDLLAGQERSGLVAFTIPVDSKNIDFKYAGVVVPLFRYNDVVDSLIVRAPVGQFTDNSRGMTSILVNNVTVIEHVRPSWSTLDVTYNGAVAARGFQCADDPGTKVRSEDQIVQCALVIVNVTVRNEVNLPWKTTFSLQGLDLSLGESQQRYRSYEDKFQEVLDSPIDLKGMDYGDERTGQMIYLIGQGVISDNLPIKLVTRGSYTYFDNEVTLR